MTDEKRMTELAYDMATSARALLEDAGQVTDPNLRVALMAASAKCACAAASCLGAARTRRIERKFERLLKAHVKT